MYVVKKPINLRGRRRCIGELVLSEDVEASRADAFIRSGYLARIDSGLLDASEGALHAAPLKEFPAGSGSVLLEVPILRKEGTMVLSMAPESISGALELMQMEAKEAVKEIGVMEEEDLLILLHACDSRKAVKEAAKSRAEELQVQANAKDKESGGDSQ